MKEQQIREEVQNLLFPRRCPVCDKPVLHSSKNKRICDGCRTYLPIIMGEICMKCGRQMYDTKSMYCADCLQKEGRHHFVRGIALCAYVGVIKSSIYRLKYEKRPEYAQFYGELMGVHFIDFARSTCADALIPVPLSKKREQKRGYNQASLLARAISKQTGIAVCENLVERVINTAPMKNLDYFQRQNNLKRAFKIKPDVVKLKITIVIDDIYTTGSTIDAISEVLLEAGVSYVYFMSLAIGKN